jgi:hypothetical protein
MAQLIRLSAQIVPTRFGAIAALSLPSVPFAIFKEYALSNGTFGRFAAGAIRPIAQRQLKLLLTFAAFSWTAGFLPCVEAALDMTYRLQAHSLDGLRGQR